MKDESFGSASVQVTQSVGKSDAWLGCLVGIAIAIAVVVMLLQHGVLFIVSP